MREQAAWVVRERGCTEITTGDQSWRMSLDSTKRDKEIGNIVEERKVC